MSNSILTEWHVAFFKRVIPILVVAALLLWGGLFFLGAELGVIPW